MKPLKIFCKKVDKDSSIEVNDIKENNKVEYFKVYEDKDEDSNKINKFIIFYR